MYEVKRKGANGEETIMYQSWYDVWLEGWTVGPIYLVVGLITIVATPFVALYSIAKPRCMGYSQRYRTAGTAFKDKQPVVFPTTPQSEPLTAPDPTNTCDHNT